MAVKEAVKEVEVQKEAKPHVIMPVMPARFQEAAYVRNQWVITAFEDAVPEDALDPAYWAHVAGNLRIRDRVELWAEDGSWFAEYVILAAARNWAKAHLLGVYKLVAQTDIDRPTPGYEIRYRGMHNRWGVIRHSDNAVIHEGDDTREIAAGWLANHLKAVT